jgi:ATP-binding cassette, subfamily C, bacterial
MEPNPNLPQEFSLAKLARMLSNSVSPGVQVVTGLLSIAASLTEGISLALLAPLIGMLGAAQPSGSISRSLADTLTAFGLPLSLPLLIAVFVALVAGRAVIVRVRDVALAALHLDFVDALRTRLFDAIANARWSVIAKERRSILVKSLTGDIEHLGQGVRSLLQFPALALTAAVQIAIALWIAPGVTLVALACGCALLGLVWSRHLDSYLAGREWANALRHTFDLTSEFFAGLKLAKSRNAEAHHRVAFEEAVNRQRAQVLAYARRTADARMLFQIGSGAALGVFVYFAAGIAGVAAPELLVLVIIFARLTPMLGVLQNAVQSIRQSLPILGDIYALIARCEAGAEPFSASATDPIALRHELRFSGVRFDYDEQGQRPALNGIDLVVPAGSVVAIVGASGAGKSTLADIAAGLVIPDAGVVAVDGKPLHSSLLPTWRRSVAYVLQDSFLFNDTVRTNLLWARPDAEEQDLRRVLSLTGAEATIASLPNGIDSPVGDRGSRLSGGERQRLALACALLRHPTLLILDEATNALDQESERTMWELIERLRGSMTIFVIAHRIWTVRGADTIVVIEEGRIVESGSWNLLIARSDGRFARLVRDLGPARGS